jgi:non-specific serine/threonine protein kinase
VRAARLWGAAEALLKAIEVTAYVYAPDRSHYQSQVTAARAQIDDDAAWETAWAEGRAMTPEQAVEYATSGEEPTPLTAPVPEKPPTSSLTRREREVAILVARELTNRQIASELTLSERTVETHVRNILSKLGLRSRAQLAPWLTEQGLLGQDLN